MVARCTEHLLEGGKLWDQDPAALIAKLRGFIALHEAYQGAYRDAQRELAQTPKGRQFELNEPLIFGKLELFCRRAEKLADMFATTEQFSALAAHNIEGMEGLLDTFRHVIKEFHRKPY